MSVALGIAGAAAALARLVDVMARSTPLVLPTTRLTQLGVVKD